MAVFIKKKEMSDPNKKIRRCLNCGKDISNKRKDAKFCCQTCYNAYYYSSDFNERRYNARLLEGI